MPYIEKKLREAYDEALKNFPYINSKGDLEYIVFKLMKYYMAKREYRYSILHDVVYAIQHCSDEFRRRFLDERENQAKETNGDIE